MRTNDLFLVAAAASMMMFAACTHDDGTLSTASPASNEIVITTRSSDIGFTRAESGIQSTQFLNGEHIDIFLRDASGVADLTTYGNPYNYQTNGSGGGILTRDGSTVVKEYWPKLMHPLYIYGIYPQGAVGWSKRKTSCADENTYKSEYPKVSIISSVYNREKYIPIFIRSIQNQILVNIELIFVDDCSEDNSIEIIERYKNNDSRIILIKNKKNKGTLISRNIGALKARGEFLVFPDSDDILSRDILNICYKTCKTYNYDLVRFNMYSDRYFIFGLIFI